MVPEGWAEASLGDLLVGLDAGVSVNSRDLPCGSDAKGILKTSSVSEGRFDPSRNKLVDEADELARLKEPVRHDTIIISRMNTPALVGANGYVSDDFPNLFLPDRLWAMKTHQNKADCRWLGYWMASTPTRFTLSRLATGTSGSMKNITKDDVRSLHIKVPPLPEQRKIAEILTTWDGAIETIEALLANARTQKRALMQSLLTGNRRFPEFEGQEWREVRLGEMGRVVSGGTPDSTTEAFWDGDIAWATPTDITQLKSRFIGTTARRISEAGLKASAAKMVPAGSLLVCTRATVGDLAIAEVPICTNQGFKNLVLSPEFDAEFVFYLLQFFKNELIRYACGSTFLELSKGDFEKRAFRIPALNEQRRISSAISAVEDQIAEHVGEIDLLRSEKKSLMQQLLTGKRRVIT